MASCLRTFLCGTAAIVALSSAGIDGATAAAPGLVAAYSFDSSGTVVPDASGNGNSGTATNTTWVSSGRYGGAFSFDGSTSWVTVADSASLHVGTFTVEAWVNPKSALRTDWQAIAVRERSGGLVFGLYANSNRSRPAALASVGAAERSAYGASQLKGGTWTHLAETFDGSSLRIYANGKLASALAASGTLATSTSPLRFGGDAVWNEFFRGSIDDARVYSRALSAAEIATDMSTPVGSTPAPADAQRPSAPTGLHITSQTATSITAAWTGSTDNVGVTAYGLYRDGFALGSTSSTSAAFTGLGCGRSYALAVDAVDAAGNRSAQISLDATTSACADTTPPTTPGGLVASAVAETSVTLDWTASADATGVSGYGVYRDGAQTGASTTTSATVVGLTCASPYSLAVDAVDAAGNRSAKAAVAVTTAACSGSKTGASFFVAPGGSDAGSCTAAQPCATFNRALSLAAPGQVVQVAAGTYPAQTISAVKAGPLPVVVQPAAGAVVTVASLDVSGAYVEVRGMRLTSAFSVEPAARFATLRDIRSPRGWVVGDNTTIVGGEIGPVDSCATGTEDGLQIWQRNSIASSHVTVDGVYIHDVDDHDNSCSGFANAGVHDDCVQILAGHFTTIRNSTFYNCPTSNVLARPYRDTLDHLTIEGNVLLPERRPGASLSIGSSGDTCAGVVIQYNTLLGASSVFDCSPTMIVRGNIFPSVRGGLCGFGQAPKYSYNVWQTGPACGATDRVCTPSFANTAVRDVHLAAADTCAKDHGDPATYPATDFDGQARPLGAAPDVGADESG